MRFWTDELQTLLPAQADPPVSSGWKQHGASSIQVSATGGHAEGRVPL